MKYSNLIQYKQAHKGSCEYCREHISVYRDHNGNIIKEIETLVCYGVRRMQECEYEGNKHKCRFI